MPCYSGFNIVFIWSLQHAGHVKATVRATKIKPVLLQDYETSAWEQQGRFSPPSLCSSTHAHGARGQLVVVLVGVVWSLVRGGFSSSPSGLAPRGPTRQGPSSFQRGKVTLAGRGPRWPGGGGSCMPSHGEVVLQTSQMLAHVFLLSSSSEGWSISAQSSSLRSSWCSPRSSPQPRDAADVRPPPLERSFSSGLPCSDQVFISSVKMHSKPVARTKVTCWEYEEEKGNTF